MKNISPQSHTHTAVCQSRKDWQPRPSWWCTVSLKGSLGDLSTFNTTLKGKWKELYCSFSPVVLSCLWLLFSSETSTETEPGLRLLSQWSSMAVSYRAGCSIFPLSLLLLQAEGWQEFHWVLPWVNSAFPPKHWDHHWGKLRLNLTQLLPAQLPATAYSTPPGSREGLLCPTQGYDHIGKAILCKTCVPASGNTAPLCLLPLALDWASSRHCGNPSRLVMVQTSVTFVALCGRPQVLFSVAV